MHCTVVVPFLNEAQVLPRFLASVEAQTRRPDHLVLCDDGSTDASAGQATAFADAHDWATVLRRPARDPSRDRLTGAPELGAFLWAVAQVPSSWDVVVKMDADLELAPEHFATVLAAFAADPQLGMAGTYLSATGPDGVLRREPHPREHVRGPTRFYRRACFEDVSPIPQMLGWDGADEVRARARGWHTRSVDLPGRPSVHLRPTGSHDGRLRAFARWGLCAYTVGSHPAGVLAGGAARLRLHPRGIGGVAYVAGYARAVLTREPRMPDDIRRAKRAEDVRRIRRALRRS